MQNRIVTPGRSHGLLRRRALGLAAAAALLPLAACNLDEALSVKDPYTVTPPVARDTVNLPNTYAGAVARFATGISGRQNREGGLILQSGTLADELIDTDGFATRQAIDRRAAGESNAATLDPYTYLQRARAEAVNASDLFATTSQNGSVEHANLYNIVGYSELLLAENFCSGVPLSLVDVNGQFLPGAQQSTSALVDSAIVAFQQAATMAGALGADGAAQLNLARVGMARAMSFQGRYTEAAAIAAQVPDNFRFFVEYDAATQNTYNVVFQIGNEEKRWGVRDNEGTNGLVWTGDPRTPTAPNGTANDGGVTGPHIAQRKYTSRSSDVLLASGMEARYIQAEAALKAGQTGPFLTFLNQARAIGTPIGGTTPTGVTIVTLPALATAGADATAMARTLFSERAHSLWLTAHRVGDLRRQERNFGFPQNTIWPIGADVRGGQYGTDVSLTIPQEERNNPSFTGCLAPPSTA
ncbi:MAG TPA: hypothetical protein VFJ16_31975 [Longimicrobium sp.]|nr:hypothetical protein [Longimicrobium sp.]